MQDKRILISGASIAGPALAYWLERAGAQVTVVEHAPALRPGGYAVDIRGAAMKVIERMGLGDVVRAADTASGGVYFVDAEGHEFGRMSEAAMGNADSDVEIMRDDLSRLLYSLTSDRVEYIWGDSIRSLSETTEGIGVAFEHADTRTFDLVIGADGLHSTVRRLTFGDESQFLRNLGCYISIFTLDNYLNLNHRQVIYSMPGRTASYYTARDDQEAKAIFMFQSPPLDFDHHDAAVQKQHVAAAFAGESGWQVPKLLTQMAVAPDFYFDAICQIQMPEWHRGRVVLVGDSAYCPSPASGQGTSLALVGAYILAGELAATPDDYSGAFERYERLMRPFVEKNQKIGQMSAGSLVQKSRGEIRAQKIMLHIPGLMGLLFKFINKMIRRAANDIKLPVYLR